MKMQTQEGMSNLYEVLLCFDGFYGPLADHFDFTVSAKKRLTVSIGRKDE